MPPAAPHRPEPLDVDALGFWAGYRAWLAHHRVALLVVGGLLLAAFLAALWANHTPQDPFTYDNLY